MAKKITLEVGKSFRDRSGLIHTITAKNPDGTFTGEALVTRRNNTGRQPVETRTFTDNGRISGSNCDNIHDLRHEEHLQLEVGKQYEDRQGLVHTVLEKNSDGTFVTQCYWGRNDHTAQGLTLPWTKRYKRDLKAEVVEWSKRNRDAKYRTGAC